MTLSIWRYSHLLLALISAVFIFLASVTGVVLAFEPIEKKLQPYAVENAQNQTIAKTISVLETAFDEVVSFEIDENNFVKASVVTKDFETGDFYINPVSGKILGEVSKKKPIYEFATNLHRSLFLKSTGRFLVGVFSFLLFLIATTGVILIAKRQGGFKRWFSKVVNENFQQYYHVVIGRYALVPIVIITLTGVFLSLERFSVLPNHKPKHKIETVNISKQKLPVSEFSIFKETKLEDLVSVEFPFSEDEEDFFVLKLKDSEVYIHQYTGAIVSNSNIPVLSSVLNWSLFLHTGRGSIIWSVVLGLSCLAIFFFMYSGFVMTLKRRADSKTFQNIESKDKAEIIVLVGSETGNTFGFAKMFAEALVKAENSVFVDSLDNYTTYEKAKQLVVFTSTYGEGDAPSNSKKFEKKLQVIKQPNTLKYSVLGFGSLMYPDYCKYAIVVDSVLQQHQNFTPLMPVFKIDNQSAEAFETWVSKWSISNSLELKIEVVPKKIKKLKLFTVVKKTDLNLDNTFTIGLKPHKKMKFASGDLLAVYPDEDKVERLYSIAKIDNQIFLSVKQHEFGVCSKLLNNLDENAIIKAKVKRNLDFHLPNDVNEVIMISNGTGIAPFLGMINDAQHNSKKYLFWGGRTKASLKLYKDYLKSALDSGLLDGFYPAFSQGKDEKKYVQDLILEHKTLFSNVLKNNGVIMICGAIAMQNGVLDILNQLVKDKFNKPLSYFENNEQLKMDCY